MEISILLLLPFLPLISLLFLLLRSPALPKSFPPGPRPWPVVGNLLQLGPAPHAALARMARDHGPLISLRLGSEPVVVASTPAAAEQVLRANDRALSGRHVVHSARMRGYAEHSLVWSADCGDYWRRCRGILRAELLGPKVTEARTGTRGRKVSEMVAFIKEREGELVEIGEVVLGAVLNLFGELVFSRSSLHLGSPEAGNTKTLFCKIMALMGAVGIEDYFPVLSRFDAFGRRRAAEEIKNIVCGSWEGYIRERRGRGAADSSADHDFLDVLIDAGLSDEQINAFFLDIFVGGTDTTNTTVEWAMAELMKNPRIMVELRRELEKEIGEGPVDEFHLPRLHYLQACVKETLRLHPPAPLLPHRALENCELMNYGLPNGCQVMVNLWAIGRDPETWDDPTAFSPERFIRSDIDYNENNFRFIPFGGGRRICPGMSLAARVLPLVLASLVHNFEWRLPDGMHLDELAMGEKFGLTLKKDPPLLLVPQARRACMLENRSNALGSPSMF